MLDGFDPAARLDEIQNRCLTWLMDWALLQLDFLVLRKLAFSKPAQEEDTKREQEKRNIQEEAPLETREENPADVEKTLSALWPFLWRHLSLFGSSDFKSQKRQQSSERGKRMITNMGNATWIFVFMLRRGMFGSRAPESFLKVLFGIFNNAETISTFHAACEGLVMLFRKNPSMECVLKATALPTVLLERFKFFKTLLCGNKMMSSATTSTGSDEEAVCDVTGAEMSFQTLLHVVCQTVCSNGMRVSDGYKLARLTSPKTSLGSCRLSTSC